MEMPFGQSPFAIGRGVAFEALLRRHGHAELRRVLTEGLGTDFSFAAIENLREGYQPNRTGLRMRATVTQTRMAEIADGAAGASGLGRRGPACRHRRVAGVLRGR